MFERTRWKYNAEYQQLASHKHDINIKHNTVHVTRATLPSERVYSKWLKLAGSREHVTVDAQIWQKLDCRLMCPSLQTIYKTIQHHNSDHTRHPLPIFFVKRCGVNLNVSEYEAPTLDTTIRILAVGTPVPYLGVPSSNMGPQTSYLAWWILI
jgi:hypothetical protein